MIPVTQTRTGENGNCMAAALASLLELPLHVIPELSADDQIDRVQQFLADYGLYYAEVLPDDPILDLAFAYGEVFHIISGTSPRGGQHAVVGRNGKIVHDPHPQDGTGRGLIEAECFGLLCARMARPKGGVSLSGSY